MQGTPMRSSRQQAAASREKIIEVASRRFRERGVSGIGVADLMKDAGFTHGGFYAHFDSKDDLLAQACDRALEGSVAKWQRLSAEEPAHAFEAIVASYLRASRLDEPTHGCAFTALGSDLPRQSAGVRAAITGKLRAMMEVLAAAAPGRTKAARRKKALAAYAGMVGAVILARAVDDPALAREILKSVSGELLVPAGGAVAR
jgi:TetR/AcrR family transcriptional repressor of nem operon